MTTTTTTTTPDGKKLQSRRLRLGLPRTQLAALADCSLSALANIEAGAVPKRSEVLSRILAVLDHLEANEKSIAATVEPDADGTNGPAHAA